MSDGVAYAPRFQQAVINANGTSGSLIAAVAGQRIRVYGIVLALTASHVLTLWDGSTAVTGGMPLQAITLPKSDDPWFVTQPGNAFDFTLDVATPMGGVIYYLQD